MSDVYNFSALRKYLLSLVSDKFQTLTLALIANNKLTTTNSNTLAGQTTHLTAVDEFLHRFARGANVLGAWEVRPGIVELSGRIDLTGNTATLSTINFPLVLPVTTYTVHLTPILPDNITGLGNTLNVVQGSRHVDYVNVSRGVNSTGGNIIGYNWLVRCNVPFNYSVNENTYVPDAGEADASGATLVSVATSRAF